MQNRKWQVQIVEDEYRIGMLIKHLIDWDESNPGYRYHRYPYA